MVFEVNGVNGSYDNSVSDSSIRYGINAANNHKKFVASAIESSIVGGEPPILDFMPTKDALDNNIKQLHGYVKSNDEYLKSLPPIEYEYRYMPEFKDGKFDKKALLGAAYGEMGKQEISTEDFERKFLPDSSYTIKALDLNKDNKIDVSEYSASMLAADMLSKPNPNIKKIDGKMNSVGMDAVMEYAKISNADAAAKLYSKIYSTYQLNEIA